MSPRRLAGRLFDLRFFFNLPLPARVGWDFLLRALQCGFVYFYIWMFQVFRCLETHRAVLLTFNAMQNIANPFYFIDLKNQPGLT